MDVSTNPTYSISQVGLGDPTRRTVPNATYSQLLNVDSAILSGTTSLNTPTNFRIRLRPDIKGVLSIELVNIFVPLAVVPPGNYFYLQCPELQNVNAKIVPFVAGEPFIPFTGALFNQTQNIGPFAKIPLTDAQILATPPNVYWKRDYVRFIVRFKIPTTIDSLTFMLQDRTGAFLTLQSDSTWNMMLEVCAMSL
jgi:hypothetical protein